MREAAYWLYFQGVDFMIHLAALTGTTYRDTNSALFFVLWPAVTAGLLEPAWAPASAWPWAMPWPARWAVVWAAQPCKHQHRHQHQRHHKK